jgi:NAD(P)-dependent dehydrogenase (short-subunit alcohol dehydrogenase family)
LRRPSSAVPAVIQRVEQVRVSKKYYFNGKTAFITGGGRRIGLASAEALAEAGAKVIMADRDEALLQSGQTVLEKKGYNDATVLLDVTQPQAVTEAALKANSEFGAVDILLANAGIAWPDTASEDMADDIWLKMIDVNLNGVFWSCRAFARPMLERGHGAIVTIGSMSGLISNKPQRQSHYNASKAAVHHSTRSLAGEWAGRGVRVNSIAPTHIDTSMLGDSLRNPELSRVDGIHPHGSCRASR